MTKPHTGFVYLAHLLSASRANAIAKLQIDGITLIPTTKRVYPRSWAASQVLGTVGWDDHGTSGLEYRYNSELRGTNGERRIVNDAIGQPISIDNVRTTSPGKTMELTIDAALQDEVEQVLAGVGAQYSAQGRDRDRDEPAQRRDPRPGQLAAGQRQRPVLGAVGYASQDRAVGFNYEPGSTFKAITVAGALQDGLVTPNTEFNIPPVLQVADRQIHDAETHGDEKLTVAEILKVSSNIGADEIGMKLGANRFNYWVHRFGFGSPTGVDLPGEDEGIVLPHSQYSGSSMGNLPFGQGESVTPIQMATAYAAIANGGILRPPHIVQSIGGKAIPTPAGHRIISPTTRGRAAQHAARRVRRRRHRLGRRDPRLRHGRQDRHRQRGRRQVLDTEYVASFIGMVPTDNPKLLVAVVVDGPQGAIYGGSVAAPAFQKIVGWAVPYFGISPR